MQRYSQCLQQSAVHQQALNLTPAAVQFPPGMAEHLKPWAGWLLRLAGLMLACCHLAAQWRQLPPLHSLLPGLPMLRLLPDAAALAALSKVGFTYLRGLGLALAACLALLDQPLHSLLQVLPMLRLPSNGAALAARSMLRV